MEKQKSEDINFPRLLDCFVKFFPELVKLLKDCENFIKLINTHEVILKSFENVQEAVYPEQTVLKLILPNNTRKWSGSYLMVLLFVGLFMFHFELLDIAPYSIEECLRRIR